MEDSWEDPLDPDGASEAAAPGGKRKWPAAEALVVAEAMIVALAPACLEGRCVVAGSLRRRKAMVGDVEIVFVPRMVAGPRIDMFTEPAAVPATNVRLGYLLGHNVEGKQVLAKRRNKNGSEMWGEKNKLGVHLPTGIPVDFFETTEAAFWNYLVCRTGGKENNVAICMAARAKGWRWQPYEDGFAQGSGLGAKRHRVSSEREVFEFVGMRYLKPEERK